MSALCDLHMHSTASDGALAPADVVARARAAGLAAIALTDHDSVGGVAEAQAAGERLGVRVVAGCEFAAAPPWDPHGELHLLGYFLPIDDPRLDAFLAVQRAERGRRVRAMVARLAACGVRISEDAILDEAKGGSVGRPHVARALVKSGGARHVQDAFDRFIGRGRPAFVSKALPAVCEVTALVHALDGVVSVAHLKGEGTSVTAALLAADGVDALETRHPSHDGEARARLTDLALAHGLARTGGSDWHGDDGHPTHGGLGSQQVPLEWLERLEQRRAAAGATG
ncbi:MAG: PHP domain-containing protein [Gemmatimonadales bacterium]|nr:PHP domain-containing protein [Gemmatimonadales bacterium]